MAAVSQLLAPHQSPAWTHFESFYLKSPLQFIEPRQDILGLIFTDEKKLLGDGDQERTGYLFGLFWHTLWYQLQLVLQNGMVLQWHLSYVPDPSEYRAHPGLSQMTASLFMETRCFFCVEMAGAEVCLKRGFFPFLYMKYTTIHDNININLQKAAVLPHLPFCVQEEIFLRFVLFIF